MKKMKKILLGLSVACCMIFISCSKEEPANEKMYYGKVAGELKGLPGTPVMDVYINDKKVSTLNPGGALEAISVGAGEPIVLELKKENTDILLIDTFFVVDRNQTASFTMVYSEELGIKGFLQSRAVAPDSVSIQLINELTEFYSPAGGLDLYICKASMSTLEIMDTVARIPNFEKGVLQPMLTLKADDINYPSFMYVGMLKDRQTGEFLFNEGIGFNLFLVVNDWYYYTGRYSIGVVSDDPSRMISTNLIDL